MEFNKEFIWETEEKITPLGSEMSSAKILQPNSVFVALNGQGKTKGMTAVLKIRAACNQSLCAFQCNPRFLFYEYLYYCFKSMYKYLRGQAGDTSRDGLAASFVRKQLIPVPSVKEQQTIAEYLDTKCSEIDALISVRQSKIEALKEYKKSIIYEYVTGKKSVNACG